MNSLGDVIDEMRKFGVDPDTLDQDVRMVVLFMAHAVSTSEKHLMDELRLATNQMTSSTKLIADGLTELRTAQRAQGERIGQMAERITTIEHSRELEHIEREADRKEIHELAETLRPLVTQQTRWRAQLAVWGAMAGVGIGLFGQRLVESL